MGNAYRRMNALGLMNELASVAAAMENNPAFKGGVPQGVASAAQLLTAREKVRFTYEAALTHDSEKIKDRKAAEEEAVKLLDSVAAFYQLAAVSQPGVLFDTGFTPRPQRRTDPILPTASGLSIYQGPSPNSAAATVNPLSTVHIWELQVAEGGVSSEQSWRSHVFNGNAPMILHGLNGGRAHDFRIRGHNRAGAGAWSTTVSFTPK
jgi:hypothetical protein